MPTTAPFDLDYGQACAVLEHAMNEGHGIRALQERIVEAFSPVLPGDLVYQWTDPAPRVEGMPRLGEWVPHPHLVRRVAGVRPRGGEFRWHVDTVERLKPDRDPKEGPWGPHWVAVTENITPGAPLERRFYVSELRHTSYGK